MPVDMVAASASVFSEYFMVLPLSGVVIDIVITAQLLWSRLYGRALCFGARSLDQLAALPSCNGAPADSSLVLQGTTVTGGVESAKAGDNACTWTGVNKPSAQFSAA